MVYLQRFSLWAILVFAFMPFTAHAQEVLSPDLTQTYIAPNSGFSIQYPADWEIIASGESAVFFTAPIIAPEYPQTNVLSQGVVVIFRVTDAYTNMDATEVALAEAAIFGDVTEFGSPAEFVLNDKRMTFVTTAFRDYGSRFFAMDLGDGRFVVVNITGFESSVYNISPIIFDMLGTFRLAGDDTLIGEMVYTQALTASYTRPDNLITFRYPKSWSVTQNDVGSCTLIFASNGANVCVGGSLIADNTLEAQEAVVHLVEERTVEYLETFSEDVASDILEFTINGQPAARIDFNGTAGFGGHQFIYIAIALPKENVFGIVQFSGTPAEVENIEGTMLEIAETIAIIPQ